MTAVLLSFGWNWLLVPVAIWFLRGVYVASTRPRLRYCSHTRAPGHGLLIVVKRQERLPPWRELNETWLVKGVEAMRTVDGYIVSKHDDIKGLWYRLAGLKSVIEARDAETEELSR